MKKILALAFLAGFATMGSESRAEDISHYRNICFDTYGIERDVRSFTATTARTGLALCIQREIHQAENRKLLQSIDRRLEAIETHNRKKD